MAIKRGITMEKELQVNGFKLHAVYNDEFINQQIKPLIVSWQQQAATQQRRIIVFLAAPPGAGKSTLALFIESLCNDIQALSLDGFHYPQQYLKSHSLVIHDEEVLMSKIKGSAETFDTHAFKKHLEQLAGDDCWWPIYDRNLHDVIDHQIHVTKPIVLIEGNWLLLNELPWNEMVKAADATMFIHAELKLLKERLIERKIRGGSSPEEALHFYETSDRINCERVMKHSLQADIEIDESVMF